MKKYIILALSVCLAWVYVDYTVLTQRSSCDTFDPRQMAHHEATSWRAYYENRRFGLLSNLVEATREQFDAPFWTSVYVSYTAVRAALTFKKGRDRTDYAAVLPHLRTYFKTLDRLTQSDIDVEAAARDELEWWIIRRETQKTHEDWADLIAAVASHVYGIPVNKLQTYATLKVKAMTHRDDLDDNITQEDWIQIEDILFHSWSSFKQQLKNCPVGE